MKFAQILTFDKQHYCCPHRSVIPFMYSAASALLYYRRQTNHRRVTHEMPPALFMTRRRLNSCIESGGLNFCEDAEDRIESQFGEQAL